MPSGNLSDGMMTSTDSPTNSDNSNGQNEEENNDESNGVKGKIEVTEARPSSSGAGAEGQRGQITGGQDRGDPTAIEQDKREEDAGSDSREMRMATR